MTAAIKSRFMVTLMCEDSSPPVNTVEEVEKKKMKVRMSAIGYEKKSVPVFSVDATKLSLRGCTALLRGELIARVISLPAVDSRTRSKGAGKG